jgi:hypothetical protein
MCSTREARLAKINEAIKEVAAAARGGAIPADMNELADRVADIWAMVADLDPTLTARLRDYYPDPR